MPRHAAAGVTGPSRCDVSNKRGYLNASSDVYYINPETVPLAPGSEDRWLTGAFYAVYSGYYNHEWSNPAPGDPPLFLPAPWAYKSEVLFVIPDSACSDPTYCTFDVRVTTAGTGDIVLKMPYYYWRVAQAAPHPLELMYRTPSLQKGLDPFNGTGWAVNFFQVYYRALENGSHKLKIEFRDANDPTKPWFVIFTQQPTPPQGQHIGYSPPITRPNDYEAPEGQMAQFSAPVSGVDVHPTTIQWQESAPGSGFFGDCFTKCGNTTGDPLIFGPVTVPPPPQEQNDHLRRFRKQAWRQWIRFAYGEFYVDYCQLGEDISSGTLFVIPANDPLNVGPTIVNPSEVQEGDPFTAAVTVSDGQPPYTYIAEYLPNGGTNWGAPRRGQPCPSPTNTTTCTYRELSAVATDAGQYRFLVRDNSGMPSPIASQPGTLVVRPRPPADLRVDPAQPELLEVEEGEDASFSCYLSGDNAKTVCNQWIHNGAPRQEPPRCPGAPAFIDTMVIANVNPSHAGRYWCRAWYFGDDTRTVDGDPATLIVKEPGDPNDPHAYITPEFQQRKEWETVSIRAASYGGTTPLSFQWKRNVDADGDGAPDGWANAPDDADHRGATTPDYTMEPARPTDTGAYRLDLTNGNNNTNSSNIAQVIVERQTTTCGSGDGNVVICEQPEGAVRPCPPGFGQACEGHTFTVIADGRPPLSYDWQEYGCGRSGCSWRSTNKCRRPREEQVCTVSSIGQYRVVVSNSQDSKTSDEAVFAYDPLITTHPASPPDAVEEDSQVVFSVFAFGTNLAYEWGESLDDGSSWSPIAGANSSTYQTPPLRYPEDDGHRYRALVIGAGGTAWSNAATVRVTQGDPSIIWHPDNYRHGVPDDEQEIENPKIVEAGDDLNLHCEATSKPDPNDPTKFPNDPLLFEWYRDADLEAPLPNGCNEDPQWPSPVDCILAREATSDDDGKIFRCEVVNADGDDVSRNVTVNVVSAGCGFPRESREVATPQHEYRYDAPGDAMAFNGKLSVDDVDIALPGTAGHNVTIVRAYAPYAQGTRSGEEARGPARVMGPLGWDWTLSVNAAPNVIDFDQRLAINDDELAHPWPSLQFPGGGDAACYPPDGWDPDDRSPVTFLCRPNVGGEPWGLRYWPNWKAPERLIAYEPDGTQYDYYWYITPYDSATETGGCCPARGDGLRCIPSCEYQPFVADTSAAPNNTTYFYWRRLLYTNQPVTRAVPVMVPARIRDPNGNVIALHYRDMGGPPEIEELPGAGICVPGKGFRGRLSRVIDTVNRPIDFVYDQPDVVDAPPRLTAITAAGHALTYGVNPATRRLDGMSRDGGLRSEAYTYTKQGWLQTAQPETGARTIFGWDTHTFRGVHPATGNALNFTTPVVKLVTVEGGNDGPMRTGYEYPSAAGQPTVITNLDVQGQPKTQVTHRGYDARGISEEDLGRVNAEEFLGTPSTQTIVTYDTPAPLLIAGRTTTAPVDELFAHPPRIRRVQQVDTAQDGTLTTSTTVDLWDDQCVTCARQSRAIGSGPHAASRQTTALYDSFEQFGSPSNPGLYLKGQVAASCIQGTGQPACTIYAPSPQRPWLPEQVTVPSNPNPDQVTRHFYYPNGNLQATVQEGVSVACAAYQYGVCKEVKVAAVTVRNCVIRPDGNADQCTDQNGQVTTFGYDTLGRLTTIDHPGKLPDVTTITYDTVKPLGQRLAISQTTIGGDIEKGPPLVSSSSSAELTNLGETLKVTGPGNIVQTFDPHPHTLHAIAYLPGVGGPESTFVRTEFDHAGRVTRRLLTGDPNDPDQVTTMAYPTPFAARVTDTRQFVTSYESDGFGRTRAVREPNVVPAHYTYNHLDQVTSVERAFGGMTRRFEFERNGALKLERHPETGDIAYTYDAMGRPKTKRVTSGDTTIYDYEPAAPGKPGRIKRVTHPDRAATEFTYFEDNPTICQGSCRGSLVRVTDATGTTDVLWRDERGRVLSKRVTLVDPREPTRVLHTYTASYEYDGLGRVWKVTYPSGRKITYRYDDAGRLMKLTQGINAWDEQDIITSATYTAPAIPDITNYGNGLVADWDADLKQRIRSIVVTNGIGNHLLDLRYTQYDPAFNLKEMVVDGKAEQFQYDELNRLQYATLTGVGSSSNQIGTIDYDYDFFGNMTKRVPTNLPEVPRQDLQYAKNQVLPQYGFRYDPNGNVIQDLEHSYTFTSDNQLRQVDGGTMTYYYNYKGERVIGIAEDGAIDLWAYEGGQMATHWRVK